MSTNLTPVEQFSLTGLASLCVNLIVHPLCTINNQMFARGQSFKFPAVTKLYPGFLAAYSVDNLSFAAAYYTNDRIHSTMSPSRAAVIAGLVSTPIVAIGEGLMVNRQVNNITYRQALRNALRLSGIAATVLREVPFNAAVFAWTPYLSIRLNYFDNKFIKQLIAGTITGFAVGTLTTPLDKTKTILQCNPTNLSIKQVAKKIFTPSFIREALFRGFYTAVSVVVVSVIYDQVPRYLHHHA